MKPWTRRGALAAALAAVSSAAVLRAEAQGRNPQGPPSRSDQDDVKLPSGKLQRDEILKAEHEQNIKDAAQLADLARELQEDLEKNDRFVLSLSTLKKTDEIEKLVKRIRSRLKRN